MELRFHPGRVFATRRVLALLSEGGDVLSTFFFSDNKGRSVTVWVLTEADRGRTILMCPEESPYRSSDLEEVNDPSFYGWPSSTTK